MAAASCAPAVLTSDFALLDRRGRHDLTAELVRAVGIVARQAELGLELFDLALRLGDRRVGARGRGVVLSELGVELAAIEPRENLSGRDRVAVLGVEFDDRQAVDPRRDQRLLARDERPGDEQPVDEFALRGGRDGHRRRLDEARRLGRRGADGRGRSRAVRRRGKPEPGERRGDRRAGREIAKGADRGEAGDGHDGEDYEGAAHQRDSRRAGEGRDRAGEQRSQDAGGHRRLGLAIEIRLQRAALEQAGHQGEDDARGEFRVQRRGGLAFGLGRLDEHDEPAAARRRRWRASSRRCADCAPPRP